MIRHIFMGTFKTGLSEGIKQKLLSDMKEMKEKIPGIVTLEAGFSTGWTGKENQILVTADVKTKENFDAYMAHPYRRDYITKTAEEYLEPYSFVFTQFIY